MLNTLLFCALNSDNYMWVSNCKIDKEIWDTLCVIYEGISEVKNSRLNILLYDYELSLMLFYESISNMFIHFIEIVISLHAIGHIVINTDKVSKNHLFFAWILGHQGGNHLWLKISY